MVTTHKAMDAFDHTWTSNQGQTSEAYFVKIVPNSKPAVDWMMTSWPKAEGMSLDLCEILPEP